MSTRKERIITSSIKCKIININHEKFLEMTFTGVSQTNYGKNNFSSYKESQIVMPLWCLPYSLREQRKSIKEWEITELDFINRIKNSFNQEI
jgi:hypothetical protein